MYIHIYGLCQNLNSSPVKQLAFQSYCWTPCSSDIIKITYCVRLDAILLFSLHHIQFIGWKWRSLYISFDNYPWAVSKIHSCSISSQQLPCHPLSLSLPFALSLVHYWITLRSCWAKGYKQIQEEKIAIAMGTRTIHWPKWVKKVALMNNSIQELPVMVKRSAAGGRLCDLNLIVCVENALVAQQITL